jgi:Fe-S cluster assembly protein SufD
MNAFDDAVAQALAGLTGGPGLAAVRRDAARRFKATGTPHVRLEDWKYTNLSPLLRAELRTAEAASAGGLAPADMDALPLAAAGRWRAVLVNGVLRPELSRLADLPGGVTVRTLRAAPSEIDWPALLDDPNGTSLRDLNTALLVDALLIEIAAEVELGEVLQIVSVTHDHPVSLLQCPRLLVRLGPHSRLRLLEEHVSHGVDTGLANVVTEVRLAQGAALEHHRLQNAATSAAHLGRIEVEVGADAAYGSDSVVFGGSLTRVDIDVALAARGARCRLHGLFVGTGDQHIDHHTRVDHRVGDTHSEELYRGILDQRSRGVFNGKVVVRRDAQRISARQTSNNLLLSREAEIDTKPELEIHCDDVACTHGATVGDLDPAALFYLRSRGVPEARARALLTYAFARAAIAHIPLLSLREAIERRFLDDTSYSLLGEALANL